ncbi:MAG: phosphatase PAP2 family protein [Verrucomicrobiota bacterium]
MKTVSTFLLALVLSHLTFAATKDGGFSNLLGPRFQPGINTPGPIAPKKGLDILHRWNEIAVNASGLDHTPVPPGDPRIFGEQLGPGRASRAMAIVHIAMFDVMVAIEGRYKSYTNVQAPNGPMSLDAAVAQAARDTLVALYPSQTANFDVLLTQDLAAVKNAQQRANGIDLGHRAASALLSMRVNDGSQIHEPHLGVDYFPSDQPGHWRQDPISLIPIALGAHWGACTPFVCLSGSQFRAPPPPPMTSDAYTVAYNEAKNLGGDGVITPTQRTDEQTFIGIFWAYDGTPSLCAPPRLYNQLVVQIADQKKVAGIELARLLALSNVAMADACMGIWDSKYYYDFWRPVIAIRESDVGSGPTGLGDGNPNTVGDPTFSPLGAPASNLAGPNFTPPFPTYPSGHGGFGGALFETLHRFFETDNLTFTFVSDEFNGTTRDSHGNLRPLRPRTFSSFSQAAEENGQSRIYLGIHWSFDKTEALALGRRVGDYVFDHAFMPTHR